VDAVVDLHRHHYASLRNVFEAHEAPDDVLVAWFQSVRSSPASSVGDVISVSVVSDRLRSL
jgi:hypothetical protein